MKKLWLFAFAVFLFSSFPLWADDLTISDAEPYETEQMPQWLKDTRRAEIITLGSWPFTTLLVSFGYSFTQVASHDWNMSYLRNPFSTAGGDYSFSATAGIILTSLGLSVGIGITDLVMNMVKRKSDAKKRQFDSFQNVNVIPLDSEDERIFMRQGRESEHLFGNLESAVF